jgi:hypothetical protein
MGMVAQNCLSPGFSTMLYLLTNSMSKKTIGDLRRYGDRVWIKEYLRGAVMEIYEVRLGHEYAGMSFREACGLVFKHHCSVLFAIGYDTAEGEEGTFGSTQRIYLNPYDLILLGKERAYIITETSLNAHKVGKGEFPDSQLPEYTNPNENEFWRFDTIREHLVRRKEGMLSVAIKEDYVPPVGSLENFPYFKKEAVFQLGTQSGSQDFTVIPGRKSEVEVEGPRISSSSKMTGKEKATDVFELGKTLPTNVAGHVLLASLAEPFPSNASYFVAPFREVDDSTPIVFLTRTAPEEEVWETISELKNVFYIVGSPLIRKDLRRARVQYASRTVILSDPFHHSVSDRTADSCMMLALLNVQAMCGSSDNFVCVEFVHNQNMKLIGQYNHSIREAATSEVTELQSQNIIPAFVGGHVFSQSMFHSVLCQAYYEQNLLTVLKVSSI